jgi:selenocysteine lyase/cysteine desulfurase
LIKVVYTAADLRDSFDLEAYERCFKVNRVRLVSMVYTSNVTGVTLPVKEMIAIAHRYGARVLLDGAQTVPHQAVDVRALDVDFLAFSIHKMCGPRGVGVLYANSELIGRETENWIAGDDFVEPVITGGGTVRNTTYESYDLKRGSAGFEAGIQDYASIIASGVAVKYLQQIGMERIAAHEKLLNSYLSGKLLSRYGDTGWFTILGPEEASQRGGILTFVIQRPNAIGISKELNAKNNIMIRPGIYELGNCLSCSHNSILSISLNELTHFISEPVVTSHAAACRVVRIVLIKNFNHLIWNQRSASTIKIDWRFAVPPPFQYRKIATYFIKKALVTHITPSYKYFKFFTVIIQSSLES